MGGVVSAVLGVGALIVEVLRRFDRLDPPIVPPPHLQHVEVSELDRLRQRARAEIGLNPDFYNIGICGQRGTGVWVGVCEW